MNQSVTLARAEALLREGKPAEAMRLCEKTLRAKPKDSAANRLAGIAAYIAGDDHRAITFLSTCTTHDPRDLAGWLNLGNALQRLGRLTEAISAFDNAITLQPTFAAAHFNRGNALHSLDRFADAVSAYSCAVEFNPRFAKGYLNLGLALKDAGQHREAAAAYRQAITLQPNFAQAHTNLGVALLLLGKTAEAIAAHRRAIALEPGLAQGHTNLGNALMGAGQTEEARAAHQRAIALQPGSSDAHYNLGCVVSELGGSEEAIAAFQQAVELNPQFADAHFNLALEHLRQGQFETGWAKYEWRWHRKDNAKLDFAQPQWAGESLDGKTILLHAEQGLGDTLQFARYALAVADRGGRVVLEVQPCLYRLLQPLSDRMKVIKRGEARPSFDLHCPLVSLPGIFRTSLTTIPAEVPYLWAEAERVKAWRDRLPKEGIRVGINWQGNPAAAVERGRSVPLKLFAPLAAIPNVHLISLQKIHGLEQLESLPSAMKVETLGDEFDSGPDAFIDTAAVMANLDLVITSDTSVAHLAGALARPVWILLKHLPEWRWLLDRSDSPWYPTATLFRQTTPGDWTGIIGRVAQTLAGLAR